jgi:hypothetical protein
MVPLDTVDQPGDESSLSRQWEDFVDLVPKYERGSDVAAAYSRIPQVQSRCCVRKVLDAGARVKKPIGPRSRYIRTLVSAHWPG